MAGQSDRHWEGEERPSKVPSEVLSAYKQCQYQSQYVRMEDGVQIALDTLLPEGLDKAGGAKVPTVLFQTRYHRGMKLRWPLKRLTNGRPLDMLNLEVKSYLLAEGYGIASMDVRGTGASFGRWSMAWPPEERRDSVEVIDWIIRQPWSDGQVVLLGQSYDGTAALFTTAQHHPAVKGCAALYAFWDLYSDISVPGGIAIHSFPAAWGRYTMAMDKNDYSGLPFPADKIMKMVSKGCMPVVDYSRLQHSAAGHRTAPEPQDTDASTPVLAATASDDSEHGASDAPELPGSGIAPFRRRQPNGLDNPAANDVITAPSGSAGQGIVSTASNGVSPRTSGAAADADIAELTALTRYMSLANPRQHANPPSPQGIHLSRKARKAAKRAGRAMLAKAVAGHDSWNAAKDAQVMRFTDQLAPQAGVPVTAASLCALADQLAAAGVPLLLISGWLDVTAAAAIHAFVHAGHAPGSQLILGPWAHGGICDNRTGHFPMQARSAFYQARVVLDFCNRCCRRQGQPRISRGLRANGDVNDMDSRSLDLLRKACLDQGAGGDDDARYDRRASHSRRSSSSSSDGEEVMAASMHDSVVSTTEVSSIPATAAKPGMADSLDQPLDASRNMSSAPVHYFAMGDGACWKAADKWPSEGMVSMPWFLGASPVSAAGTAGTAGEPHRSSLPLAACRLCTTNLQTAGSLPPPASAAEPEALSSIQHAPVADQLTSSDEPAACSQPQTVAEGQEDVLGLLSTGADAAASWRWQHKVDAQKHFKGRTRYDAMSRLMVPIRYSGLRSAGHLTFTGPPLQAPLAIVGWVGMELWIESSDSDADVFAYLEDVLPDTGKARYITEGCLRASHRKTYHHPPAGNPRAKSELPGVPFRSFEQADVEPVVPGQATCVRFQMLPTAYTFPKGHCIRLAVAGADAKHFYMDHSGQRTIWVHTGGVTASRLQLPVVQS